MRKIGTQPHSHLHVVSLLIFPSRMFNHLAVFPQEDGLELESRGCGSAAEASRTAYLGRMHSFDKINRQERSDLVAQRVPFFRLWFFFSCPCFFLSFCLCFTFSFSSPVSSLPLVSWSANTDQIAIVKAWLVDILPAQAFCNVDQRGLSY